VIARLATIAGLEFVSLSRTRWIRLFAVAFALLAVAAAHAAGSVEDLGGPEGFARTTVALVPLVLLLVPLAALLMGINGQGDEPGAEAFVFTQPVARGEVLVGRWLGEAAALGATLAAGFGAAAAFLALHSGASDLGRFVLFVGASTLLGVTFLSLAALVAVARPGRSAALGAGAFLWLFFVLLHDAAALWAAGWLTGRAGGRALFVSVFLNPVDIVRILALSFSGTPHVFGAAGEAWKLLLGGETRAALVASLALLCWVALPLEAARRLLARRDL
jgi:Cu-processing system permease protein